MRKCVRVATTILLGCFFCTIQANAQESSSGSDSGSQQQLAVTSGQQIFDAKNISGSSSLSVSQGATAIIDFGQSSILNLTGNIDNSGSIYAISSNPAVQTASFSALNITNNPGALLSTVIPSNGFSGFSNLVQNLNLSITAINNIVNAGTISSAGNLGLSAGNSITNTGVMTADQNINMVTGLAGLVNSGLVNSIAGNISISNLASQNLIINNTNGALQALLGSVNLATLATSSLDKLNLSIFGGDILSNELNLTTQEGIASVDVDKVSGQLNVSAGEVHVTSRTDKLLLGSMNITGDPTFFNPSGSIQITGDLVFSGQNLAIIAFGDITTSGSTAAVNINTSSAGNGGNILMVAGVTMAPNAGGTGGSAPGSGPDTLTQLTLSGASATGGLIDLTQGSGISALNTSSTGNGQGGSVTLVAYDGAGKGTITLPGSVTINTGTATSNAFTLNGNVSIIAGSSAAGNAISIGGINASGNSATAAINNGLINIFSATPAMYQSINQSSTPSTFTTMNGGQFATQNYLIITDQTNVTAGQTYVINPTGANSETVTVSNTYAGGTTVPLLNPLKSAHGSGEYFMAQVNSVQTYANAGPNGPILQAGAIFGPGTLQNGNISVGSISSGANVVIGTSAQAGGGTVNLNGNITLSQNPLATTTYNDTPVLQVTGNTVNIASSSTTISSAISGCSFCQDQLNIFTQNLTNAGTISGTFVNINNPVASTLTVSNSGTISGINPGSTAGNPWVNIQSGGGISFNTNGGSLSTISVPSLGVITVTAADNNQITISGLTAMNGGTSGLVSLCAQGAAGAINLAANSSLQSAGAPLISLSTANLSLANGSSIQASGASSMIFTSGSLVQSPQPLTITVASGGSASITSTGGASIILRPSDGQNLTFASGGTGSNLAFSGAPVYLFTGTSRSTATAGALSIGAGINVTAPTSYSAVDPNGGITGIAFEPYVGPAINFPGTFTLYSTYTYPQTLLLMAPIAQTGLFQNLGTYTQGAFAGPGNPDLTQKSSYVIIGAAQYTAQAAKQMGLTVSAGAYSQNPDKSVNVPPTEAEIDFALQQAVKYGNVMDVVVGNECIIGDAGNNIQSSVSSLVTAINYAQTERNNLGFNSTTLPITTRQTYGSLAGVNNPNFDISPQTINLLNGCAGCYGIANYTGVDGHVYGDVYPYYDGTNGDGTVVASSVVGYLVPGGVNANSITSISQTDFQTLVTAAGAPPAPPGPIPAPPPTTVGIQADLNGTIAAFQAKNITPQLWVAETGWATASTQPGPTVTTALPNNAPQANPTWASYYYPDMQSWSYSSKASNALGYQIPINGYFEAYDEPWKYTTTTWQGGEPNFGIWTATGTNQTAAIPLPPPQFQLTGITQKFTLPIYNQNQNAPLPQPPAQALVIGNNNLANATTTPTNFSAFNLAAFNLATANINTSLADTRGTIIPTDINPELKAGNEAATSNPNASNILGGILGGSNSPTLAGNLVFNQSQFGLNPKDSFITFTGSNLLLAPDHDISINTNLAQIQLDAGAAVMLIQTGSELAIFALHDDHSGAVRVSVDGQSMQIPVGRQLVLSKDQNTKFDSLNPSSIGYRNLSDGKMGTLKAYMSEFSLPTALSNTQSLKQLIKSADKEEQDLARKLLKTAAAMIVVGKNKTPFKASR